ncbi:hypothetical protein AURDEDRAFT_178323 [Auricularia subglabra TFB-10046 SS5]|uniref:Uncharacterized protein n=1 Tax=Auricularia subglabra (strain TFB-10046 / SS5) TaxID=717982 RepID=J0L8D2_AURST|nr:hypothetical protein AURDEDRAFT_178323 [Auricularia subglabra TFB-10046 SS5]
MLLRAQNLCLPLPVPHAVMLPLVKLAAVSSIVASHNIDPGLSLLALPVCHRRHSRRRIPASFRRCQPIVVAHNVERSLYHFAGVAVGEQEHPRVELITGIPLSVH